MLRKVFQMTNPLIAFDESGNTGQDLINPRQPIFSLASVYLSDVETEEAIEFLTAHTGKELKFSNLIRSAAGLHSYNHSNVYLILSYFRLALFE